MRASQSTRTRIKKVILNTEKRHEAPPNSRSPAMYRGAKDEIYVELLNDLVAEHTAKARLVDGEMDEANGPKCLVKGYPGLMGKKWTSGKRGWAIRWGKFWRFRIPDDCGETPSGADITAAAGRETANEEWRQALLAGENPE
jgi:hypothetical protein